MKHKVLSMNTVLLISLISTVVIVLLSAVNLFFRIYRDSLIQNASTSSLRSVSQVSNTVQDYLNETSQITETLEKALEENEEERRDFFDVFLPIRSDVVSVSTYDSNGDLVNCYSLLGDQADYSDHNLSFHKEQMDLYEKGYISAPHVVTLFEGNYPWVVTMVKPLSVNETEKWMALDISCNNISYYINDVGIGQRGYCFIMDKNGDIVYHPQQQLLYSDLKEENTPLIGSLEDGSHLEGSLIYTVQTLKDAPWRVVGVSSVSELITGSLSELLRILLLSAVLILVAMLLISFFLSKALADPVKELALAMEQFEQNADSFTYTPVKGVKEVRTLSESFGHMVTRLQNLMETVREEQDNLRKTELKALQAQINPHFLYNTLDSISWMCEQGRNEDAVKMVNSLARLFRISISRGHELIPIRSELQHAESYLQIQSFRYKNQFSYRFETEEDCLDYLCNKITLQPIIENAIYHGINGLADDDGLIVVSVKKQGEDIMMSVSDNGTGMSAEQIESVMNKKQSDRAGIGIKNVNDRLKIYFGPSYGITIDSTPDVGTTVKILMPKVREESEYEKK